MRNSTAQAPQTQGAVIPFTSSAHEHTEGPFYDNTFTVGEGQQPFGPINIPSYGYLRNIYCLVTCPEGELKEGELSEDYPFCLVASITTLDTNGAPMFGPYTGYQAWLANLIGAPAFRSDVRSAQVAPWYVGTIKAQYSFRTLTEISHHDGLGCLANQNSAAAYQIQGTINTLKGCLKKGEGKIEKLKVRVRLFLEAWSLPNPTDRAGRPQAQLPPAHGTTQFWSVSARTVNKGQNNLPITRVGNLIRNIICVCRNAEGLRSATVFPEPAILSWDARQLTNDPQPYRENILGEKAQLLGGYPTGVFAWTFNHSSHNALGDDNPSLWLQTVQASRIEINGATEAAGTMEIMINDIAPGEVIPADRYVETSQTGFHPQVGVSTPGTQ